MPKDDPQASSEASPVASRRGRVAVVLFVLVLALLVAVGVVVSRGEDAISSAPSTGQPSSSATTSTAVTTRAEVTSRLREILEIRDRALVARDSELLREVYTIDCKCLEDGRALIRQLQEENVVWKGVTTEITIESTEEVSNRLWIVVATVRTPPVRIETEAGQLIRIVPAERNLVRFALAKPQNEVDWLLGHASSVS